MRKVMVMRRRGLHSGCDAHRADKGGLHGSVKCCWIMLWANRTEAMTPLTAFAFSAVSTPVKITLCARKWVMGGGVSD
jgi:hypothetical protein